LVRTVRYISTRGKAPALSFDDVLLAGLARDGGLYVPEAWPGVGPDGLADLEGLSYTETAVRIMAPFVGDSIPQDDFAPLVTDAYTGFDHPDVAPITPLGEDQWLLELFHGPTLSFKDYALQLVGRLFDYVLEKRGERITVVGATSGDTGSAAIEGCRDRDSIEIFILHPKGRVSEVQRRQMTSVLSPNVHNIAVEGTFDDCQDLVKGLFNDVEFRDQARLAAFNSINWARIMAQIVYYFWAWVRIGEHDRAPVFSVPTGNFGNVFAGYVARNMGLPAARFAVGSNRNDILTRFFASGRMEMETVVPTISPSMDIQVSSNFERLLFDLYDRDGSQVAEIMEGIRQTGIFTMDEARLERARALFQGARLDDQETKAVIHEVFEETGNLVDPHSAIGIAAGRKSRNRDGAPLISVATAHPAKFPDAVEEATGQRPALPRHLADLLEREERFDILANDLDVLRGFVSNRLSERGKL